MYMYVTLACGNQQLWREAYCSLEYSYSKYCNLIGQLLGTIFRSALIQGTILIVPHATEAAYMYLLCNTVDYYQIIHVLRNLSSHSRPLFVYISQNQNWLVGSIAADVVLHVHVAVVC